MGNRPLVSVIVNCFNGEQFLAETISSVLLQTYPQWELIFWDNCSTDKSSQIIKDIQDDRIKYYLAESKTPLGAARNLALAKAKGDYLSFLDADDIWEKDFLQECVDILDSHKNVGLVYSRYTNFSGNKSWLSKGNSNEGVEETGKLVRGYNIGMSAAMFRSSILNEHNILFDKRFSLIEDFDFFLRIAVHTDVYYISAPLMRYRHHVRQTSISDHWADELDLLLNSIKTDLNYSLLSPYFQQIENLKGYYVIMHALDVNHKTKALKQVLKQCLNDIGVLRYLVPIVFGKKLYLEIRKKIDNSIYG